MPPATDARVAAIDAGTSPYVPGAMLLIAVAALPLLAGGLGTADTDTQIVAGSITVLLLAVAALLIANALPDNDHGLARWRLGPWYLVWCGLGFGVASLTWLGPQTGSAAVRISPASIPVALAMVAAALVAWTMGYVAGPPHAIRSIAGDALAFLLRGTNSGLPGGAIPWLLFGIGTAARLASLLLSGGFGYVGDPSSAVTEGKPYAQALSTMSMLAVFGIAVAAYRLFTTRAPGVRGTLVTLLAAEIVVGALSGSKEKFVVSLLAVLIPYGAVRGKMSARVLTAGALMFLLVVLPFNVAYRSVVRSGDDHLTAAESLAVAPEIVTAIVTPAAPGEVLSQSVADLLRRVRMIDSVAIIGQKTPDTIPYRSPTEFALAPVISLVPRAVWPDKPVLTSGYQFSQEYYALPPSVYTSSAITVVGDLYRHGGWPVLVGGALLFGLGCRLFDQVFRPEADLRAVFFALTFLPVVVKSELDMYTMVIGIPTGIITGLVGAHLACRGQPTAKMSAP